MRVTCTKSHKENKTKLTKCSHLININSHLSQSLPARLVKSRADFADTDQGVKLEPTKPNKKPYIVLGTCPLSSFVS